ncbi:hypothetical protein [Paenibacillus beijingensis]|uniref:hypothetical protein n=1 Tax=Paenibacillus beijingensis TaxID=1126833 RepID=UPI0006968285|nr:hypothetical protein [Paenibacillus beijingensis]
MKKTRISGNLNVTGPVLAKTAAVMLPLYKELAKSRLFASKWCQAVREADLGTIQKLFRSKVPSARIESLSTNGIGFFVDLSFPKPLEYYTNATTIPPGTVQFTYSSSVIRRLSASVLPFYRGLSSSPLYAKSVANAVRLGDKRKLNLLIRLYVKSTFLIAVETGPSGFSLAFKYPAERYVYMNEFFHESLF